MSMVGAAYFGTLMLFGFLMQCILWTAAAVGYESEFMDALLILGAALGF